MNADSITKLTEGLFDGIKSMKKADNYMAPPRDYPQSENQYSDHLNENNKPIYEKQYEDYLNENNNPNYEKQYEDYLKENPEDEYDEELERVEDKAFEKNKYELLPEEKNPLRNFYNEVLNDKTLLGMSPKNRKKIQKRRMKSSTFVYTQEFDKLVNKVQKKSYKWLTEYQIYNYIVKGKKKYKVVSSTAKMDKSKAPTPEKLKFLDKLIKKADFTKQVCKKFIEKNNTSPSLITEREIDQMIKPFYKQCLIKAFEKKIKYTRRG